MRKIVRWLSLAVWPGLALILALAQTPGVAEVTAAPAYFGLGVGITDTIPHQLVRADDDRLYAVVAQGQYSNKLKVFWTTAAGLPDSGADFQVTETTAAAEIISVDAAYAGGAIIHALVFNRAGALIDHPFDTVSRTFKPSLTLATGLPTFSGDYIGTSGIAAMFDAAGALHVAHWSSGEHITYRRYTYAAATNTLSLVEGPTQVDTGGAANHPALAVSPLDNSITVAWVSESAAPPARILARQRTGPNTWGGVQTAGTGPVWTSRNAGVNIDQGPSLLIDGAGRRPIHYIEHWDGTGSYGRIHYATDSSGAWVDQAQPDFSHAPALARNSAGDLYLIGHGHPNNAGVCNRMEDLCTWQQNLDGSWADPQLFAVAPAGNSFDSSVSVKWSAHHTNRPETIEFLFFLLNGGYTSTTLYYGRLASVAPPTSTPTPSPTATCPYPPSDPRFLLECGGATPTATATSTATATATFTHTATATPTATATATATPTSTASATATATVTHTPTATASATATPTVTASANATPSQTVTPTRTATAPPTGTATGGGIPVTGPFWLYLPAVQR